MKYIRGIHENTMLSLAEKFIDANHLRGQLEGHPQLTPFVGHFEEVVRILREVIDARLVETSEEVVQQKEARFQALAEHDAVIAQLHFSLAAARASIDPAVAASAVRLYALLLPEARGVLRYSVERKLGEAYAAQERIEPADREAMERLGTVSGSVWALHERRIEVAERLADHDVALLKLRSQAPPGAVGLREAKGYWVRLVRLFEATVRFLVITDEEKQLLLGHIEDAAQLVIVRRRRRLGATEETSLVDEPEAGAVAPAVSPTSSDGGVGAAANDTEEDLLAGADNVASTA